MNPEKPRKTTYLQPEAVSPAVNQHMRTITDEAAATLDDWQFCYGYMIRSNPAAWLYGLADVEALRRKHNGRQQRQAVELAQPGNLARAA